MNGVILGQLSGDEPAVQSDGEEQNIQTAPDLTPPLAPVCFSPENGLAADVLGLQGRPRQKLVAEAVVEGAVQARGTAVRVQHPETLHFVLTVHQQFRFVAINADQDHVLHDCAHIAAQELIGYSVREKLQGETRKRQHG